MINYNIPNAILDNLIGILPDYISIYQTSDYQVKPKKTPVNGWDGLKSFDDLVFDQHAGFVDGKAIQAQLTFGSRDQFRISVVQNIGDGTGLYGHEKDGDYEVAMWYDCRSTMLPLSMSDDVLAGQSPTDITRLIHQAHLNDFAWVTLLHNIRDESRRELGLDD